MIKKCSKCSKEKEEKYFSTNHDSPDGLEYWCDSCKRKYDTNYRPRTEGFKVCKKCEKNKHVLKFYNEKRNLDGLRGSCIKCTDNGRNERNRQRWYSDPSYRIGKITSRGIRRSLGCHKNGLHWEDALPYDCQELMTHLESQFDDKMSWENYGKYWHIDHILPMSRFHFSDVGDPEFQQCWALSNLRPLNWQENIAKGDCILEEWELVENNIWGFGEYRNLMGT